LQATSVTASNAASLNPYTFTITFTDNVGIAAASLSGVVVQVVPPGAIAPITATVEQTAAVGKTDAYGDAQSFVVTFQITPPGGAWTPTDNGTYAVTLGGAAVTDPSGNAGPLGSLGTFTVTANSIATVHVSSTLPSSTYGQAVSFTVTVSGSSGGATPQGTIQFVVDGTDLGAPVTLSNGSATSPSTTLLGAGSRNVVADYSGDSNYASNSGGYTQVVNKAPLSIVPNNLSRPVGQANPPLTYTFAGFVNGQNATSANITGAANLSTTATISSPAANYPITVTNAGTLAASNYNFPSADFKSGTLTVTGSASAVFVKTDTTTQGTWIGTYGGDGYDLIVGPSSLPSYATVGVSGNSTYVWSSDTTDSRGLENPTAPPPSSNRIAAAWYAATSFTVALNLTGGPHTVALYAVDWDNRGRSEQIQISDANSGTVLDTETLSSFNGGAYEVWTISGNVKITITEKAGGNGLLNGLFFGPGGSSTTATATFVKTDTTTQGTWIGTYGGDGYDLIDGPSSLPSYATVGVSGNSTYVWSSDTTDSRGLENPNASPPGSNRLAAAWYAATSFTVALNLTGGPHTVAFYAVDWDNRGRSEQIQISDANSGTVLDTETLSSFNGGAYEVWTISGNVKITITEKAGGNGLLNGLFFGTAGASTTATAAFVKTDTTTQGTWIGTYGGDGYDLIDGPSSLPSYATVGVSGNSTYVWSSDTTDVRGLENPNASPPASNRLAAAWYAATSFTVALNLTGGPHTVALYAVDWDNRGRSEQIQISDANSGTVLDTETLSSFNGGAYEVWTISGNVKITITEKAGGNGLLNGLFFAPAPSVASAAAAMSAASVSTGRLSTASVSTRRQSHGAVVHGPGPVLAIPVTPGAAAVTVIGALDAGSDDTASRAIAGLPAAAHNWIDDLALDQVARGVHLRRRLLGP
jgi:hypothetical protein